MQPAAGRKKPEKRRSPSPDQKGGWRRDALEIGISALAAAATALIGIFGLGLRWWADVSLSVLVVSGFAFVTHALRSPTKAGRVPWLWRTIAVLSGLWLGTMVYVKYVLLPGPPAVVMYVANDNQTVVLSGVAGVPPPRYVPSVTPTLFPNEEWAANCYVIVNGVKWLSFEAQQGGAVPPLGWARRSAFHPAPEEDHAALPKRCPG
jgi:hypothetical protein